MIVTVTPNPSIDRTVTLRHLVRGEVLRADGPAQVDPGGKGINVVRVLSSAGISSTAIFPGGGSEGGQLVRLLEGLGIAPVVVPIAGSVRVNMALVEPDGLVTKVNEKGPRLSRDEVEALLAAAAEHAVDARWLVGCGSLAPGVDTDFWTRLVACGHQAGALVAIDTSGPSLAAVLAAGPDLVKPNSRELEELTGRSFATIGDVLEAADEARSRGAAMVLASLGADGAVLVADGVRLHATAPAITVVSPVGAGDSLLAGFLAAHLTDPNDLTSALRRAVAYGTTAAQLPGDSLTTRDHVNAAAVEVDPNPDHSRRLRDGVLVVG